MRLKEWWKKQNHIKRGLTIGLMIGAIDTVLILITSMNGNAWLLNINLPLKYIYPFVEDRTNIFAEAHGLIAFLVSLTLLSIFYSIIGGLIGLLVARFKNPKRVGRK